MDPDPRLYRYPSIMPIPTYYLDTYTPPCCGYQGYPSFDKLNYGVHNITAPTPFGPTDILSATLLEVFSKMSEKEFIEWRDSYRKKLGEIKHENRDAQDCGCEEVRQPCESRDEPSNSDCKERDDEINNTKHRREDGLDALC